MKTKFYLTVGSNGFVKATKNPCAISLREVSIGCTMELPDVLFKRPQIEATITVDAKDVQPFNIDAETANNVKDAIQRSTGFEVKITIVNPETETV